jgi:hypothetical protein
VDGLKIGGDASSSFMGDLLREGRGVPNRRTPRANGVMPVTLRDGCLHVSFSFASDAPMAFECEQMAATAYRLASSWLQDNISIVTDPDTQTRTCCAFRPGMIEDLSYDPGTQRFSCAIPVERVSFVVD